MPLDVRALTLPRYRRTRAAYAPRRRRWCTDALAACACAMPDVHGAVLGAQGDRGVASCTLCSAASCCALDSSGCSSRRSPLAFGNVGQAKLRGRPTPVSTQLAATRGAWQERWLHAACRWPLRSAVPAWEPSTFAAQRLSGRWLPWRGSRSTEYASLPGCASASLCAERHRLRRAAGPSLRRDRVAART